MVYFNSKYNNVWKVTASRAITDYAITETTIFCNSKYNNVSKVTASRDITDDAITEITIYCNSEYNNDCFKHIAGLELTPVSAI
jgi:uncharacterized CHY-type Zn-finger protein